MSRPTRPGSRATSRSTFWTSRALPAPTSVERQTRRPPDLRFGFGRAVVDEDFMKITDRNSEHPVRRRRAPKALLAQPAWATVRDEEKPYHVEQALSYCPCAGGSCRLWRQVAASR